MNENIKNQSKILIENRSSLNLYGVDELLDFDSEHIDLILCGAKMSIEGNDLHITSLDLESRSICTEGIVMGIYFYEEYGRTESKGIISKLFSRQ